LEYLSLVVVGCGFVLEGVQARSRLWTCESKQS